MADPTSTASSTSGPSAGDGAKGSGVADGGSSSGGSSGGGAGPQAPSRRTFLRGTLVGGALLTVGGWLAGTWRARPGRAPSGPLRFLTAAEFATLSAVADTLIAASPGAPSPGELGLAERIDARLSDEDPLEAADVRTLLHLLERGAPLLGPRLAFFSAMSDEARADYLEGWEGSSLEFKRRSFAVLHSLIFVHYYDDPRTWSSIGYSGPREIVGMRFR